MPARASTRHARASSGTRALLELAFDAGLAERPRGTVAWKDEAYHLLYSAGIRTVRHLVLSCVHDNCIDIPAASLRRALIPLLPGAVSLGLGKSILAAEVSVRADKTWHA